MVFLNPSTCTRQCFEKEQSTRKNYFNLKEFIQIDQHGVTFPFESLIIHQICESNASIALRSDTTSNEADSI